MKRFLLFFIILLSLFGFAASAEEYPTADIMLNGEPLVCDPTAIIIDDRTLVPIRAVMTPFGAEFVWDGAERTVTVQTEEDELFFEIDSRTAYHNGEVREIDVPAMIVKDRTMIPLRFLAEELSYLVDWDGDTRTVLIEEPEKPEEEEIKNEITGIRTRIQRKRATVTVSFSEEIAEYGEEWLSDPVRYVLDFQDAVYAENIEPLIELEGAAASSIRLANHEEYARLVLDMKEKAEISLRESGRALIITLPLSEEEEEEEVSEPEEMTDPEEEATEPEVETDGTYKVVIDAGHGGTDPGALGMDENGKVILQEKAPNLAIALSVQKLLKEEGVTVIMTRMGDTLPSLQARADLANQMGADLFVSIHHNSMDTKTTTGTMVFYSEKKDSSWEGEFTSKEVAQAMKDRLVEALDTKDLGVRDGHQYLVINRTQMPAVLAEVGFVSNPDECRRIMEPEFQEAAAEAIAEGIMEILQ